MKNLVRLPIQCTIHTSGNSEGAGVQRPAREQMMYTWGAYTCVGKLDCKSIFFFTFSFPMPQSIFT